VINITRLSHSATSQSSKENKPKEKALFKKYFCKQNRNKNSKLAPRLRQFLTNFCYYAVEKDFPTY